MLAVLNFVLNEMGGLVLVLNVQLVHAGHVQWKLSKIVVRRYHLVTLLFCELYVERYVLVHVDRTDQVIDNLKVAGAFGELLHVGGREQEHVLVLHRVLLLARLSVHPENVQKTRMPASSFIFQNNCIIYFVFSCFQFSVFRNVPNERVTFPNCPTRNRRQFEYLPPLLVGLEIEVRNKEFLL